MSWCTYMILLKLKLPLLILLILPTKVLMKSENADHTILLTETIMLAYYMHHTINLIMLT